MVGTLSKMVVGCIWTYVVKSYLSCSLLVFLFPFTYGSKLSTFFLLFWTSTTLWKAEKTSSWLPNCVRMWALSGQAGFPSGVSCGMGSWPYRPTPGFWFPWTLLFYDKFTGRDCVCRDHLWQKSDTHWLQHLFFFANGEQKLSLVSLAAFGNLEGMSYYVPLHGFWQIHLRGAITFLFSNVNSLLLGCWLSAFLCKGKKVELILLPYVNVPNQQVVHPKVTQFYVSILSQLKRKKVNGADTGREQKIMGGPES